jgi:hypothetical protein
MPCGVSRSLPLEPLLRAAHGKQESKSEGKQEESFS